MRYFSLNAWRTAASLSILVAGCTVGPNYSRPNLPVEMLYTGQPAGASNVDRQDISSWWRRGNDTVLDALVQDALSGNLDIEQAAARIDQAGAALGLSRAALFPSGEVSTSYRRSYDSVAAAPAAFLQDVPGGYPRNQDNLLLNGAASWELDLFGGNRRGNEAARARLGAAVADAQAIRVSIVAGLVDLYVQLRLVQAEKRLTERQLLLQRRDAILEGMLTGRGLASQKDLNETQSLLADQEARAPALQAAETALLNAIDVILGKAPGTMRVLLTAVAAQPDIEGVFAPGTPSDLLRRRPDVVAAEARLKASNAGIGKALAEYFPKISLSGLFGLASLTSGDLFSSRGVQANGQAGLRWRLFDFKRVDAEIAQARGVHREQIGAYRAVVLQAARDVEDAIARSDATALIAARRTDALKARVDARRSATRAFAQGQISERDRIKLDQAVLSAEIALASARTERSQAVIQLYRALGGGWTSPPMT